MRPLSMSASIPRRRACAFDAHADQSIDRLVQQSCQIIVVIQFQIAFDAAADLGCRFTWKACTLQQQLRLVSGDKSAQPVYVAAE